MKHGRVVHVLRCGHTEDDLVRGFDTAFCLACHDERIRGAAERERDVARARYDEAHAIIQYEYDQHVQFWGELDREPSVIDAELVPALRAMWIMRRWLDRTAAPPRDA